MQDTGIVRRMDELGRVVIPKELRKTLRIREGDPLEIYTNKDELIFKKYSPIASINQYAVAVAEGIENLTEKYCIITDNDAVVYAPRCIAKEVVGKKISLEMEKAIKERRSLVISKSDGGTVVPVIKGDEVTVENQIIVPIVASGDCYGSVILYDKDKATRFNSGDVKFVQLGASFLSKQFEY